MIGRRDSGGARFWQPALLIAFAVLAVAAYCAPWIHGTGAATSLTAYDLAEWTSLVPGVRYGAQPMVVPGLLRAQLMFLALLAALAPGRRGSAFWWLCGAAGAALAAAQLPPFEYFLDPALHADVNYGQQMSFALLTVLNTAVCWAMPRGWPRRAAIVLTAVAAVVTAAAGLQLALGLASGFRVPAAFGVGGAGYIAAMTGAAITAAARARHPAAANEKEG